MRVREYPFPIDPPMSAAMRETLMYAGLVTRACRGVSRARDRRLRAAYAEATATEAPEASAFSEILDENGIKVGDFHQAVSSLVDDPVSAPTVKNLLGALAGKETAAADLGARVQDMLTRRSAAPRVHASPPSRPAASTPRAPRPAHSSGFRWEFTSAARGGQVRPSPDEAPTPPRAADPPANDPPTAHAAKPDMSDMIDEAPRTGSVPPRTEPAPAGAADVETDAGETTLRPEPKISPPVQAEPTVPPVEGEVVPTEQGIIFALEALSERSDDLKKRVEALEVLVESQAERLVEADRRLEAALRRLDETVRKQAQNQARSDQEVAELRDRIARVESRTSAIDMSAAEPRAAEGPANDAPRAEDMTASSAQVEPTAAEETPVAATASDEVAKDNPATPIAEDASDAQRSDAVTAAAIHESPAETPHDAEKTVISDEERVVKDTTSATAEQQMMQRIEGTMLAIEDRVSRAEDKAACTEEQIAKKNDFAEYIERHTKALERGELT